MYGNLVQEGFGSIRTRANHQLPIEYLDEEISKTLMTLNMSLSVSELEAMVEKSGNYQTNLPHFICSLIIPITH